MDKVAYDFVDRVFTKLTIERRRPYVINSPIWKEVSQVYQKKVKQCTIALIVAKSGGDVSSYTLNSLGAIDDAALKVDTRFNRVGHFHVQEIPYNCFGQPDNFPEVAADKLANLLNFVACFNLTKLTICGITNLSADVQKKFAESEFTATEVYIENFAGGDEFLQKLLKNEELHSLEGYYFDQVSPELKAGLEAFVCRPNFKRMHCTFPCFDAESVKKIIAYWKTEQPRHRWTILFEPGRNMADDFVDWMPKGIHALVPQFQEDIGDYILSVTCYARLCSVQIESKYSIYMNTRASRTH